VAALQATDDGSESFRAVRCAGEHGHKRPKQRFDDVLGVDAVVAVRTRRRDASSGRDGAEDARAAWLTCSHHASSSKNSISNMNSI
jgi:hypothetical protein